MSEATENTIAEGGTGCRLAFVISEDWWLSLHWIGLAEAARDAGYEVTVVTRAGKHGEHIRARGFNLVDIDFHRGRLSPWANLRTLCRLRAIYRQLRPHLVHHFAMQPIMLGAVAAALSGRPAVVNMIAGMGYLMVSGSFRARLLRGLLLPALSLALRRSHTIVQNPDDAAFVKSCGVRSERVSVIRGTSISLRCFSAHPEPEGPVRVTMVSRLLWSKGVCEFINAAAAVAHAMRESVVFTLVGAPDEKNPDSVPPERLSAWASTGVVEWWGYRRDIADVWARSHIAVLPSYYREGLPTVLIEAMACGRPIVTTDMPGCREAVDHGVNGLLVPPRDARALAAAITELANNPVCRATMGAAGRRLVEMEFDSTMRSCEETLQVYKRALTGHVCDALV